LWRGDYKVTGNSNDEIQTIGDIVGVHVWSMPTHIDERGRLFKASTNSDLAAIPIKFETYEHFLTESRINVFRGMHFQGDPHPVSKIISIIQGAVTDYLFDMRSNSATFKRLQVINLDEKEPLSIFIPAGVAHGYLALVEKTIISYRMNRPFCSNCDSGFGGELVADFLPVPLDETIRSARDNALKPFGEFHYESECSV
jgi:dTDP-4-dehydrorhamnose 3,5-epimerase